MAAPTGLEFTGLREVNAYLKKIGQPDDAIKKAMNDAGQVVAQEAWRIMPVHTGNLARTLKVNKAKNLLKVSVGNRTTAQYGYTFHAQALGKSKGGFTYAVPAHSRSGRSVRAYTRQATIPNRPFLYLAFERKKLEMWEKYVTAIADLIRQGA